MIRGPGQLPCLLEGGVNQPPGALREEVFRKDAQNTSATYFSRFSREPSLVAGPETLLGP